MKENLQLGADPAPNCKLILPAYQSAEAQSGSFETLCASALLFLSPDTLPPADAWTNPADAAIRFDDEVLSFGEAEEGDEILGEYIFTNIGSGLLEIDIVSACDCIRTDWPREKIFPGEAAKITAIYDPRGRAGASEKTLDVIFKNTDPDGYPLVKQVKLRGVVRPK